MGSQATMTRKSCIDSCTVPVGTLQMRVGERALETLSIRMISRFPGGLSGYKTANDRGGVN